jgi:hypothetical protein
MKRIRLAAVSAVLLAGSVAGCANFGQGPIMSRLRGHGSECVCEQGMGPCCDGPPIADAMTAGPMLSAPPVAPGTVPIAPAPRILVDPAQPVPAVPSSRSK